MLEEDNINEEPYQNPDAGSANKPADFEISEVFPWVWLISMAWWQLCSGRIYILSEQHDKEAVELYWSRNTSGSTAQKFKWWFLPDFVHVVMNKLHENMH